MPPFIEPASQRVLQSMTEPPPIADGTAEERLATARAWRVWSAGQLPARGLNFTGTIAQVDLPVRWGSVPGRLYLPESAAAARGPMVWLHGGGMMLGDLDKAEFPAAELAQVAQIPVLTIAYRLAPEHPFPAAIEDCLDVVTWLTSHGGELGIPVEAIAVGGESAGGSIATACALLAVQTGGPVIDYQLLAYPKLDFVNAYPSHTENATTGIPDDVARFFNDCYLPGGVDRANPLASPVLAAAEDLARMPPGMILSASADTLCDEAEAYGRRLVEAGCAMTTVRAVGQLHGLLDFTGWSSAARDVAHAAYRAVGTAMRRG